MEDTNLMFQNCGRCDFWHKDNEIMDTGRCNRHPAWIAMSHNDFCSKWTKQTITHTNEVLTEHIAGITGIFDTLCRTNESLTKSLRKATKKLQTIKDWDVYTKRPGG